MITIIEIWRSYKLRNQCHSVNCVAYQTRLVLPSCVRRPESHVVEEPWLGYPPPSVHNNS
jgi:hypothetical protein